MIENIMTHGKEMVDFVLYTLILGVIGRKLLADWLFNKARKLFDKSERSRAIWNHYQKAAQGKGHSSASVLDCGEEDCRIFGTKLATH